MRFPPDTADAASIPGLAAWTPAARRWTLAATILGSSLTFIDGTVVNVALPALQAELHATITDVQWVIEAYALFLGSLILVGGSLGDQLGRKRTFLAGVVAVHHRIDRVRLAGSARALIVASAAAGHRCCLSRTGKPRDYQRHVRRCRSGPSDWHLVRFQRHHGGHRTDHWRLADRACQLARGVLPQRAAGRARASRCRRGS